MAKNELWSDLEDIYYSGKPLEYYLKYMIYKDNKNEDHWFLKDGMLSDWEDMLITKVYR